MMFKPSSLERYIAKLPEHLQILALNAIKEEHDRWDRGDLTPEERDMLKLAEECGEAARQTIDNVILKALSSGNLS